MQKKYDASWKLLHSLHLIAIFIPILGFVGYFRRKTLSGQKRWSVVGWIYVAVTIVAFIASNCGNKSFEQGYMTFYVIYYFVMIVLACATLPAYLNAVIARYESGREPFAASTNGQVVLVHDQKNGAPELSANENIQKINRLAGLLAGQPIYSQLREIESVCGQILDYLSKNPEEQNSAHTFTNYYLPEYAKLLESYIELYQTQVKTDKIQKAMEQIQELLPTTLASFKNLYNDLYSDKAADISNSIHVMEKMMSQDGLTDGDSDSGDSIHLKL